MRVSIYVGLLLVSFHNPLRAQSDREGVEEFIQCTFHLSEVMLHDVVNPPAASRFYAYAMLGAYEVINRTSSNLPAMTDFFHVAPNFIPSKIPDQIFRNFCATYAMLEVGKQILPSGFLLEEKQLSLVNRYRKKYRISDKDINQNKEFAIIVATQVIAYAKKDGYLALSTLPRFKANTKEEGHWYPTPPEYMAAVEPQWKTVRPFFLDSARQFAPVGPTPFSKEKKSKFYTLMAEVHTIGNNLSTEQKSIASFWDCNPFAVSYSGHMAIGLKKISPGGHWMGITGIACREAKVSFDKAVLAHTLVALTLHDAFISCWDAKYRSDRIRPQAAINKYLDASWTPLLQTPPFPEYTSGHSVVSTASATILTRLFGETFRFKDTSEEYFGLPARTFNSFKEAAEEAAISRLYGGIHFRDAIEAGQQQGRAIGEFIIHKTEKSNQ